MLAQGTVGPIAVTDGTTPGAGFRHGRLNELIVGELHGRFYEQVSRGNVYSIGSGSTALSGNTITLTSSTTPIVGVWNPSTSTVNLVILQASVAAHANTLTSPVGAGPFVWASSLSNGALTLGSAPFNRKTLVASGSQAKGLNFVALTGITNNLVIFEGADLPDMGILASAGTVGASTTTSNATVGIQGTQNFDGSLIVPPGGVLALLNTTSTTTASVASRLLWEEVP